MVTTCWLCVSVSFGVNVCEATAGFVESWTSQVRP